MSSKSQMYLLITSGSPRLDSFLLIIVEMDKECFWCLVLN